MYRSVVAVLAVGAVVACGDSTGPDDRQTIELDFTSQTHGWQAGFADYPVGRAEDMGLESAHATLPSGTGRSGRGLYIAGTNLSDDLFMFWTGRVSNLRPNTTYRVSFEVEFATDSPSGCAGIGGPPGESVYVKAGASAVEPRRELRNEAGNGYYRMNIDKGNQSQGGMDAEVIGHVGNTRSGCGADREWELKTLAADDVVQVTTGADGGAWLIVGTDSGFEGRTALYYTAVRAEFERE